MSPSIPCFTIQFPRTWALSAIYQGSHGTWSIVFCDRNLQNPLFQWQQLCPLTAKEEGAFALGGHKMSVII